MAVPENRKSAAPSVLKNHAAAPIVHFDVAPAFACNVDGVIDVILAARVLSPKTDNTVAVDLVAVANLKCSASAATSLKAALDQALEMAARINSPQLQLQ